MVLLQVYIPLVVALLGIGGVLLNQHMANRREDARIRGEHEREQRTWAREDAARSYEHRRAAYIEFLNDHHRYWNTVASAHLRDQPEPPEDWLVPLHDRLVEIDIFGTTQAATLARAALDALSDAAYSSVKFDPSALDLLKSQVRRDLMIDPAIEGTPELVKREQPEPEDTGPESTKRDDS
jgi:hypothetical protein